MENLPLYISVVFGITVLIAVTLFYKATGYSKSFIITLLLWIAFQTLLSVIGFYAVKNAIPPRFPLLLAPPVILFIILFTSTKGKTFIDSLNIKILTIFPIIRISLELVLISLLPIGLFLR